MADEADAATAVWREEMAAAAVAPGGAQQLQADDEVLPILLATRQQRLHNPEARVALRRLHAGARSGGGGQQGNDWQQQVGLLFASGDGDNPKRQRTEDDI